MYLARHGELILLHITSCGVVLFVIAIMTGREGGGKMLLKAAGDTKLIRR